MGRKIKLRLLLVISLLAALALGGCGSAPESSAIKAQPETALTHDGKAGGEKDGPSDDGTSAEQRDNAEQSDKAVSGGTPGQEGNAEAANGGGSTASSVAGTTVKTPISPAPAKTGGGDAPAKGSHPPKSTDTSGKAGSGNTASSGSTGKTPASSSSAAAGGASGNSQPQAKPAQKPAPSALASISIKGPADAGVILAATTVEFKDGDTVLDLLLKAAGKKGIDVDYTGSGQTAYVAGIDNYYEFDYGSRSGWICKKNGKKLEKGAGTVKVSNGDRIEWVYSEDFLKKE
ncbi:hypothetical protein DRW41_09155 [Neobacillus piezotolerans]|uniref:Transcobalamin-like C-terminal domain-containing protein n=1 Tax=Neobacillus piezotolerans TaxID=2259171 RepID=A0A3D8GRF6_9BACI|nr:DUF4430 domain-containing protein [Neobacillus piezotolerans]RDU36862.1 hypothetical protein DRW41_09155 [Neobacillus piezotolerans]